MFNPLRLHTIWRIIGELNVEEVRNDVEYSFHLLVLAATQEEADGLARLLSDPQGGFSHPWITTATPPLEIPTRGLDRVDVAVVLTDQVDLPSPLQESYRKLVAVQVPVLLLVTGEAAIRPDAALARRGEGRRLAVPTLDTAAVQQPIAEALLASAPESLHLALGYRLPPLRPAVFNRLIADTSRANATYAFTTGLAEIVPILNIPLNAADLIVLTKNQLVMAYKIALVAGKQGTPQDLLGEIVGVLGSGFLFRQLARQLVGLIPVWGIVPKVAVSYAGTWAIGQAAALWAVEGEEITGEVLSRFYAEALARGQAVAQWLAQQSQARLAGPPEGEAEPERFWQRMRRRLPFSGK